MKTQEENQFQVNASEKKSWATHELIEIDNHAIQAKGFFNPVEQTPSSGPTS